MSSFFSRQEWSFNQEGEANARLPASPANSWGHRLLARRERGGRTRRTGSWNSSGLKPRSSREKGVSRSAEENHCSQSPENGSASRNGAFSRYRGSEGAPASREGGRREPRTSEEASGRGAALDAWPLVFLFQKGISHRRTRLFLRKKLHVKQTRVPTSSGRTPEIAPLRKVSSGTAQHIEGTSITFGKKQSDLGGERSCSRVRARRLDAFEDFRQLLRIVRFAKRCDSFRTVLGYSIERSLGPRFKVCPTLTSHELCPAVSCPSIDLRRF
ncbi:hypothetical protein TGME49_203175 [Toxoplasma gondii ME49]|uniref:Uncharacterized protein n=1 Tax=Toxoplasma gondii (strain ATCC 50611 / Me49) TaxID=508771 RepID=S8GE82_TOXGM|nr:hypothetical protein TGME49_203175 [Toxoplasma gondii ME49]EPT30150.1 hypothetical protein TGME49_203175 [Toxoplasma gondii ME49]|eukprot:XP_018637366.1 hypothetical protein TGME49_203175 [Toxoplasma gondii ME49]